MMDATTRYLVRLWTGPSWGAQYAEVFAALGFSIEAVGTEHVYVWASATDWESAREDVLRRFREAYGQDCGLTPVKWAELQEAST